MLIADIGTARAYVEVERKLARKASNNARGAIRRDVFSVLHYTKTHYCNRFALLSVNVLVCFSIASYSGRVKRFTHESHKLGTLGSTPTFRNQHAPVAERPNASDCKSLKP